MRRTTVPALLAGLVLLVGACATDDDATTAATTTTTADVDRTPSERVAVAARRTLDEGSAIVTMTISGPAGTEDVADEADEDGTTGARDEAELTIDDDFDRDRRAFRSGPGAAVTADEALIIVDGSDAYIQQSMGAATGEEGGGTWLRFDLDEAADEEGLQIEGLPEGFPFRESRQILEVLRDGDHDATEVSGAAARYEVAFDLDDATFEGDSDRFLEGIAERTGMSELVVIVTLGADEVITEVSYDLDLLDLDTTSTDTDTTTTTDDTTTDDTDEPSTDGDAADAEDDTPGTTRTTGNTVAVTIGYDDLGIEVGVEIPDDDQVTDLGADELREAFAGGTDSSDRGEAGTTGEDGTDDPSPTTTQDTDDTTTTTDDAEDTDDTTTTTAG